MTDTEIKLKGLQTLTDNLGDVEAERFIALIQREPFDYTKWRKELDEELSVEEISKKAMALKKTIRYFGLRTSQTSDKEATVANNISIFWYNYSDVL